MERPRPRDRALQNGNNGYFLTIFITISVFPINKLNRRAGIRRMHNMKNIRLRGDWKDFNAKMRSNNSREKDEL